MTQPTEIWFGLHCDGRVFPDFPGTGAAVVGKAVVGPAGMLDLLETRLGLRGPSVSPALRVAAHAAKAESALAAEPGLFFGPSLRADPWSTARRLLAMRDELVEAGWSGHPVGLRRLDALAAIEASGDMVPPGAPDRLRTLRTTLAEGARIGSLVIHLIEEGQILSPAWRGLLDDLANAGAEVSMWLAPGEAGSGGDLAEARALLREGRVAHATGDGSLLLVEASTELAAAELVTEWLATLPREELDGTVVIAPHGDTGVLDAALRRASLPALGLSRPSAQRGLLELLPLSFALAWRPADPQLLLDLLTLPRPPMPRRVARRLARALVNEPGTGRAEWRAAWAEIEAADGVTSGDLDAWRAWTTTGLHDRAEGMPRAAVLDICDRVARWAEARNALAPEPVLATLGAAARAVAGAVNALGRDRLSPVLLDRIVAQALGDGVPDPEACAEAGPLRAIAHPGALWAPARTVIWWGFAGEGHGTQRAPWSQTERDALELAGVALDTPGREALRAEAEQARAVTMASERLLLVRPARLAGEETTSHPLAHRLAPVLEQAKMPLGAERLLDVPGGQLAGREVSRISAPPCRLAVRVTRWALPSPIHERLGERRESPTGLIRMVNCQLRWLLHDVLELRPGGIELPSLSQQQGMLAHALARHVFRPGPAPRAKEAEATVDAVFDELASTVAASLGLPEHAAELEFTRSRLTSALARLASLLHEAGFEVVATEHLAEAASREGLSLSGRLDLLLAHPARGHAVIDLKWSRSARRFEREIAEGRALQLAAYGAMVDDSEGMAPGAYYLLRQFRLVGERGAGLPVEEVEVARPLSEVWAALLDTWQYWLEQARQGEAVAVGLSEAERPDVPVPPVEDPCLYCDYRVLCRVTDAEAAE